MAIYIFTKLIIGGLELRCPGWKKTEKLTIGRGGDYSGLDSSLTNILCKVIESILKDCILDFLPENNILSNKRYGFLPGRSTILQLLNVLDKWTEAINNGLCIDVVYCDFMKAFDKVSHKRLIKILKYYSLPLKVIDWIKSFLTNRKQRVLVNGIASGWHDVISGVPQGSVLGPILFVIYINTLVDVVQHSDLFLFADDNKLFKIIFNDEGTVLLQKDVFLDFECFLGL